LCIPRKCVSSHSLLTSDIGYTIQTKKQLREVYDKISDVIIEWNTQYMYTKQSQKNPKESKLGNCQDFVDAILARLDINLKFPSSLEEYIQKMRINGSGDLIFECSNNELIQKALIRKRTKFDTHDQLDKFVLHLLQSCGFVRLDEFANKYPGETALLKSFDRAFWLRHLRDTDRLKKTSSWKMDSKYIPSRNELGDHCCPFDDPRKTCSLMGSKEIPQ
jgi:hypothetical protein